MGSKVAKGKRAKNSVWKGTKAKTVGGLTKAALTKNKRGKVVSKAMSAAATKRNGKRFSRWGAAMIKARKALGVKGFVPCGGKTQKGQALLKKVRSFLK